MGWCLADLSSGWLYSVDLNHHPHSGKTAAREPLYNTLWPGQRTVSKLHSVLLRHEMESSYSRIQETLPGTGRGFQLFTAVSSSQLNLRFLNGNIV